MADRGILFSSPMVRALLEGRKTQTRRLLGVPVPDAVLIGISGRDVDFGTPEEPDKINGNARLPHVVGDRLYVREACRAAELHDGWDHVEYYADGQQIGIGNTATMAARWSELFYYGQKKGERPEGLRGKGVPSIHMPRWASRLWLEVTDVRVQRLQDCSELDAIAEGAEVDLEATADGQRYYRVGERRYSPNAVGWYRSLWCSLHGIESWLSDPWVYALTFEVHRGNIDAVEAEVGPETCPYCKAERGLGPETGSSWRCGGCGAFVDRERRA